MGPTPLVSEKPDATTPEKKLVVRFDLDACFDGGGPNYYRRLSCRIFSDGSSSVLVDCEGATRDAQHCIYVEGGELHWLRNVKKRLTKKANPDAYMVSITEQGVKNIAIPLHSVAFAAVYDDAKLRNPLAFGLTGDYYNSMAGAILSWPTEALPQLEIALPPAVYDAAMAFLERINRVRPRARQAQLA
jgi:hypothetical protein